MTVSAATLRDLHQIHQQLADLRDRVERGPKQVRAHDANVKQLQAKLDEARNRAQEMQVAINRKQLDLKAGEQKVVDLKTKLNACSSNREYQALMEQIAASEMAGSVLADEILESLEKLDALHVTVKDCEKQMAGGGQELEKVRQAVEGSAAALRAEIAGLEARLGQAESSLPSDFKADYRRVVGNKGAQGLASVEEGVCGACGKQITLNMQNELLLSKPVFCRSCGCLLYLCQ